MTSLALQLARAEETMGTSRFPHTPLHTIIVRRIVR